MMNVQEVQAAIIFYLQLVMIEMMSIMFLMTIDDEIKSSSFFHDIIR